MKSKAIGKPVELLPENKSASFQLSLDNKNVQLPYHFHEHVELVYVLKGNATIFVGNYVDPCTAGDLFVIGKNIPHSIIPQEQDSIDVITLHFREDFLGSRFFQIKEFQHIEELLKRSMRGLKLSGESLDVLSMLMELDEASGPAAISGMIRLLDILGKEKSFSFLNPIHFGYDTVGYQEVEKINKVFSFTEEHYKESISLGQIAALINFTETSFCRYFKMQTGKSYFQYLNEIRIGNACRILMEDVNKDIEEVCFTCGFNSPSTFYKQFKKIVKLTPKDYQVKGRKRLMLNSMVA